MNALQGPSLRISLCLTAATLALHTPAFGTPSDASRPASQQLSRILERPPAERLTMQDASSLMDPLQLARRTAADALDTSLGDSTGYASTLGFNTTATPTVARFAHLDAGTLKTTLESTDNPAVRELVGEVLQLKSAGTSPDKIISQLADRSGFFSDGTLPKTLGLDPGWILPDPNRHSGAHIDPAAKALRSVTHPTPSTPTDRTANIQAISQLDFFMLASTPRSEGAVYRANASLNPDAINHVVSFAYTLGNSPYLLLGFEDLYQGNARSADDLFSVDLGAANVAALTATPEPATWLTLGACTAVGIWWRRRTNPTHPEMVGG